MLFTWQSREWTLVKKKDKIIHGDAKINDNGVMMCRMSSETSRPCFLFFNELTLTQVFHICEHSQ